jgi:hypothetical protein
MTARTAPTRARNRADGAVASDYANDCAVCATPVGAQAQSRGRVVTPAQRVLEGMNTAQTKSPPWHTRRHHEHRLHAC